MTGYVGTTNEMVLPQGGIQYYDVGVGPPILFVHGFMTNSNLWRKMIPALASQFRCITPDWPLGSHTKPMPTEADLSPTGLVNLIIDFLDEIGISTVTLVGIDLGGAICQMVAAEHADRISRLVLLPSGTFSPLVFHYLKAASGGAIIRSERRLPAAFGWATKRPIAPVISNTYVDPLTSVEGVQRDTLKVISGLASVDSEDLADKTKNYKAPVLIAWPPEDRLYPFQRALDLSRALPNANLISIEDSYTYIPEDQPEQLTSIMLEFMNEESDHLMPIQLIGV
ncbi:MAG: alpha/beta hydrolase [SAR202 cluster bacterium]|nr:alpha/beta hydrolase [SAR202 cluster bacterium]